MKKRQFIIRTCMLLLLTLMAAFAKADSNLTHELGDHVTLTWYNDQGKTQQITTVTLPAASVTTPTYIYVDIQPDNGYWTDIDHLNGVEKIGSPDAAGARMRRSPSYSGLGAIATINGETYAANGAGLYQVTVPALAAGQTANQIAEICLIGTIVESTDLSTATVTITASSTYSGSNQTASDISVALGETNLIAGTDYRVTENEGGTNAGNYPIEITGMGHYKGTATDDDAFEIAKKTLKITAKAQTITYGGSISSTTDYVTIDATYGLAEGDALTSITLTKTATDYRATAYENDIIPSAAVVMRDETNVTANYTITYVNSDLTINKAAINPTVTMDGWAYGGTATVPSVSDNTSGGEVSYTYKAEGASEYGADKPINAGTHTVKATIAATDNYSGAEVTTTYTVSKRVASLSWDDLTLTYSGVAQQPTATVTNLVIGDECTVTISGGGTTPDTYTATATELSNSNYELPETVNQDFTIGKAPLSVTAKAKTITYGNAPANDGVTYSGFVNEETYAVLGGTLAYEYNYNQYDNVGSYTITPKGQTSGNYDITFTAGTLTVEEKEVGLTWGTTSFTYNGSAQAPTATATGMVNNDVIGVTVTGGQTDVGASYTATASALTGDKSANYKLPTANTTTFSIGKVALSVTANAKTITYGDVPANNGVTYSGFATGESASNLGGQLSYTYNYSQYGNVGSYTITPSGLTSSNYDISFATGTLTVEQKVVGLTWGNTSLTYSESVQTPTATATGLVNNDAIGVTVTGGQTNVGTGYTAMASALTGAKSGNYKLPAANTTTFSINAKEIDYATGTITQDQSGYTVNINEGTGSALPLPVSGNNLTYSRTLTAPGTGSGEVQIEGQEANLYTVCLPFEPITGEAVKYYTLSSVNGTTINFEEVTTTPVSNTPYLVAVTGSINIYESCDNVVIGSTVINSVTKDGYTFTGTFTGLANAEAATAGAYILQNNNKWGLVTAENSGAYIPPFRAYIVSSSSARLLIGSFDETTDIQYIRTSDTDGTERWYDLNGRRIERPTQKGVYIHNGRKEVRK